jgi:carboxymethylenebutenolidase
MCHDPASHPPTFGTPTVPVASAASLVLTSEDGARVGAFRASPTEVRGASVLVLPDNRGLSAFYEELCVRLAEQGHPALAVDYFGRTAEGDPRSRDADFPFMEHLVRVRRETLFADIRAGIAVLREQAGDLDEIVSLGFCFGGRQAFLTAEASFGLRGVIGFYGFPDELFGAPGPTQLAPGFTAPVLGLFGGADSGITAEHLAAFEAALGGVRHEIVTYPGMPHSFFDIPGDDPDGARAEACADAWLRVLDFLG